MSSPLERLRKRISSLDDIDKPVFTLNGPISTMVGPPVHSKHVALMGGEKFKLVEVMLMPVAYDKYDYHFRFVESGKSTEVIFNLAQAVDNLSPFRDYMLSTMKSLELVGAEGVQAIITEAVPVISTNPLFGTW